MPGDSERGINPWFRELDAFKSEVATKIDALGNKLEGIHSRIGDRAYKRDLDQVVKDVKDLADKFNDLSLNSLVQLQIKLGKVDPDAFERKYVSRDEFDPIKRLVWGFVTTMLIAVVGSVMALVLKSGVIKP